VVPKTHLTTDLICSNPCQIKAVSRGTNNAFPKLPQPGRRQP